MTEQIKSCPFCTHSTPKHESVPPVIAGGRTVSYIYCPRCGARGPIDESKEEAIDTWNQALRLDD